MFLLKTSPSVFNFYKGKNQHESVLFVSTTKSVAQIFERWARGLWIRCLKLGAQNSHARGSNSL